MVKLVLGAKGKGKTKYMLENANSEAKNSDGVVIYLDKNAKHMFELDRRIRLVNVSEYFVLSAEALIGFISGLIAGNSDIEAIYFDSFLTLAGYDGTNLSDLLDKFVVLSQTLKVDFIISLSMDEHELPDEFKEFVVLSL